MDKPLSRLKSIAVKKELRTYDDLFAYIHRYCGMTLMSAVEQFEPQMREFFDAQEVATQKMRTYRKPHRQHPPRLNAKK